MQGVEKMKCIKCGGRTKIIESGRVFFDKVLVNPVSVRKCLKCGEEYLGGKEYERVRQKLEKLGHGICIPELQKVQLLVV